MLLYGGGQRLAHAGARLGVSCHLLAHVVAGEACEGEADVGVSPLLALAPAA
jgi:hypothetical protein